MKNFIQPQKIGRYLKTDENGFIIPDVSWNNITNEWLEVVHFLINKLTNYNDLTSLYIRGSVPRGLALKDVSDVDLIYFSDTKIEKLEQELNLQLKQHFPFIRGLELVRLDKKLFTTIYPPQSRPYFQMLLKTQALLLWGDDQTKDLPAFKPGIEMISHAFALKKEFQKLPTWINEDEDQAAKNETIKWFFRRLVRSGLEITLDNHHQYTRDLYFCYEIFANAYPDKEPIMKLALENSLNAHHELNLFSDLVEFIQDEVTSQYFKIESTKN